MKGSSNCECYVNYYYDEEYKHSRCGAIEFGIARLTSSLLSVYSNEINIILSSHVECVVLMCASSKAGKC
jgi:hypothetical protein